MSKRKIPVSYISDQFSYLQSLSSRGIRTDLSVMKRGLSLLDNPEKKTPVVIVGGTNGKGSTTAMIGAIIRHAEYSVGCYFSPHIVDVRERIMLDGKMIPISDMARLIEFVRERTETYIELTYFEFLTLAAYHWFSEKNADLAVMEVGMGGRFDATNVVIPVVSAITGISLDHTQYLGATCEQIASEKVEIVPRGGALVVGHVNDGVRGVIEEHCERQGARVYYFGDDFSASPISGRSSEEGTSFRYHGISMEQTDFTLSLPGIHQVNNAAVALAVVELLTKRGFVVDGAAMSRGLESVSMPGRIQLIGKSPEIIVDVAHNTEGARALALYIDTLTNKRTALVIGMMGDKDIRGFIRELIEIADVIVLASPRVDRAASLSELERAAAGIDCPVRLCQTVPDAFADARDFAGTDGRVVVTGSFYTVGEAIQEIQAS